MSTRIHAPVHAVSNSARRGTRVIRNSLRDSATTIGRAVPDAVNPVHAVNTSARVIRNSLRDRGRSISRAVSRPFSPRLDELDEDGNSSSRSRQSRRSVSSSAASMSSSSEGSGTLGTTSRRQSHRVPMSRSMVQLKTRNKSNHAKYAILGVLVVIASIIVALTYVFLERKDQRDFERGFENLALEMFHRTSVQTAHVQTAFHTVASGVSSYATQARVSWPYLTMPNWSPRALNSFQLTNAVVLGFSPLVASGNLTEWGNYSQQHAATWMEEAVQYQQQLFRLVQTGLDDNTNTAVVYQEIPTTTANTNHGIPDQVYSVDPNTGNPIPVDDSSNNPVVLPVWQFAPAPLQNASLVNFDLFHHTVIAHAVEQVLQTRQPALTAAFPDIHLFWKGSVASQLVVAQQDHPQPPMSLFLTPIFDNAKTKENLVGILYAAVPWDTYMTRAVANPDIRGLHVVMEWVPAQACAGLKTPPPTANQIQTVFTYRVDGPDASFLGFGDLHQDQYDDRMESTNFLVPAPPRDGIAPPNGTCAFGHYRWFAYPSQELHDTNYSPTHVKSWLYAFSVVVVFCIATVIFLSYDYLVQLRQKAVLDTAMRSNAIVTNLFPSNVRDRIMQEAEAEAEAEYQQRKLERKEKRRRLKRKLRRKKKKKDDNPEPKQDDPCPAAAPAIVVPKNQLKDFLSEGEGRNNEVQRKSKSSNGDDDDEEEEVESGNFGSKPIADLFPAATVLFADIVGFTAWSSVREPTQVFQLLETLYHHFDEIANRRKVFKVETIGDCYVAVTGLPDPRPDHAIVMSRFARDILLKSRSLCQRLEVILGPDTGDLCLRIGLHSGAVTAGVLRGEKSRFQLFGDTVNTAARMESNGAPNKIHMSQDTAQLLQAAGKKWTKKRQDLVEAKGKGKMQTYWLATGSNSTNLHLSASQRHLMDSTNQNMNFSRRNLMTEAGNSRSRRNKLDLISSMIPTRKGSLTMADASTKSRKNSLTGKPTLGSARRGSASGPPVIERRGSMDRSKKTTFGSKKNARLVRWNAEVLSRLLRQIVARRNAVKELGRNENEPGTPASDATTSERTIIKDHGGDVSTEETKPDDSSQMESSEDNSEGEVGNQANKRTVLEEVQEIIHLPTFDAEAARNQDDPSNIQLDEVVKDQLLSFVTEVGSMYRYNPFHNFEHASHVTMSVVKLLSRIVAPDAVVDLPMSTGDQPQLVRSQTQLVKSLHDHTYGITSDPLTQFAVVMSALIHDLDHPGVPNATLVKEGTSLATLYKNKSVAEQNSVDLAYEVLMGESYNELRSTICATRAEKKRFRQLVVNAVMATDIADQELKKLRNARWDKAFKLGDAANHVDENPRDEVNRKATIVIEHLIQASDIAHTMQHWHIYRKWNERFFEEMYNAYQQGRAETDPSTFWYKGEIGFFDFYIIPLAKKLKECGVFGVSSDEYLNYAELNRKEWELKGKEVVQDYIEKYGRKGEDKVSTRPGAELEPAEEVSEKSQESSEHLETAPAVEEAPSN